MRKTKNAILVAMTVAIMPFSMNSFADDIAYTAHDRAMGKNKTAVNYNSTNGNGQYEVYRGVWSDGEISNDSGEYEEVYSGVWRKKATESNQVMPEMTEEEKRYQINRERKENGLSDKEIASLKKKAEETAKSYEKSGVGIAEGDADTSTSKAQSYSSNISTSTSSRNTVGNNEYRSSNVISSSNGVTVMKGEQSAQTRIPALEALIN